MDKYLFLRLKIYCGEHEFYSERVHKVPKGISIRNFSMTCAKEFYSSDMEKDGGIYYFNGEEIAVKISLSESISRQDYEVLTKYL